MPGGRHYRLTFADALGAHEAALKTGGLPGIPNPSYIQAAIGRPYTGYYRSIHKKAAALVESLCGNHGFADGNKRTCLLLLHLLLTRSGYTLEPLPGEEINQAVEDLIVAVADGNRGFTDIEQWMRLRVVNNADDVS